MTAVKHAIRQALRAQRRCLPREAVTTAGSAVAQRLREFSPYRSAASVLAYIANENEVPTDQLLAESAEAGQQLYLPRSSVPVGFVSWRSGELLTSTLGGVLEPGEGRVEPIRLPAVVLAPVVGWDVFGTRLGRGGGFYDRMLAVLDPGIVRIGLAYEFQEQPELPRDVWDVPLHVVITEQRIVRCVNTSDDLGLLQKGDLHL